MATPPPRVVWQTLMPTCGVAPTSKRALVAVSVVAEASEVPQLSLLRNTRARSAVVAPVPPALRDVLKSPATLIAVVGAIRRARVIGVPAGVSGVIGVVTRS